LDKDNPGQFGHGGAHVGFQALLTMNSESGQGVAIMANSDNGSIVEDFLVRSIAKEYGWHYSLPELRVVQTLLLIAKVNGAEAALPRCTEFKKSGSDKLKVEEATLDKLGEILLFSGQEQDAITVFQRNAQEYPQSANAYDSLGTAYAKVGQKELAIKNYDLSLELDPKNQTRSTRSRS
ncbi:MAG: serine hydrolase, partial [Bryobacteraceae bacterium]